LHDKVADLEAENDQLRATITSMQAAHVARDEEREARLTKSVADAAAAENARVEAQRQAWHYETLLHVEKETAATVKQELASQRTYQQAAEKSKATAETKLVHAEALAATRDAEKASALQALEAERAKREKAEKATAAAELKFGRAEAHAEVLVTTREEDRRAASQALEAERRALDAERKAREMAVNAASRADARTAEYAANVARLERELDASRTELSQTRDALHAAGRNKDAPATGAKIPPQQPIESNQRPRRTDKESP
jgi:colicin import membrane protein